MRLGKAPTAFPLRRQLLPLLQFSTSGTEQTNLGRESGIPNNIQTIEQKDTIPQHFTLSQ